MLQFASECCKQPHPALPSSIIATAELLEGWWKIRREVKKWRDELKFQCSAFEINIEVLLRPLIAEDAKIKSLLEEPRGPLWKDPDLEAILQKILPKSYAGFMGTIGEMVETVEKLHDALGMDKSHFQTHVAEDYHTQRVKLSLNKSTREKLFRDFGRLNKRLEDMLVSAERLERPLQNGHIPQSWMLGIRNFWHHGNCLFDLLTDAWSCHCQAFHHANLLFQYRTSSSVSFYVAFWFKRQILNVDGHFPWTWQDTKIELINDRTQTRQLALKVPSATPGISIGPAMVPVCSTPNSNESGSSTEVINAYKLSRNSLAFKSVASIENKAISQVSLSKQKASWMSMVEDPALAASPLITNLCTKIANCSSELAEYGCLQNETHRYIIRPCCESTAPPKRHMTLEALLSTSSTTKLDRLQRFQITLVLASSHF
ncbi:hypothetical protein G7Y89_g12350 [Cudoniella acicularis]|uniref:Uncharacterized protein n=1 Tax=Cudoniella acicularis TaxID=354080 RepID=A0A8H4VX36_9HELO|nr:hypothetical protein G7Y89_g12350 [Cudoniella acicularis]